MVFPLMMWVWNVVCIIRKYHNNTLLLNYYCMISFILFSSIADICAEKNGGSCYESCKKAVLVDKTSTAFCWKSPPYWERLACGRGAAETEKVGRGWNSTEHANTVGATISVNHAPSRNFHFLNTHFRERDIRLRYRILHPASPEPRGHWTAVLQGNANVNTKHARWQYEILNRRTEFQR